MVIFNCSFCSFFSNRKNNYIRHLNTPKHRKNEVEYMLKNGVLSNEKKEQKCNHFKQKCNHFEKKCNHFEQKEQNEQTEQLIQTKKKQYPCRFCSRVYYYRQNRSRHEKTCTQKVSTTNQVSQINIYTNTYSKTYNNINLKINHYKSPDRSHLSDKEIFSIINSCNSCVPNLVEKTYFDERKPENHSIYINNLSTKYAYTYLNNQWQAELRDTLITELIDLSEYFLEGKINSWKRNTYYKKAYNKYSRYQKNCEKDDVVQSIKDKLILLLYNLRHTTK